MSAVIFAITLFSSYTVLRYVYMYNQPNTSSPSKREEIFVSISTILSCIGWGYIYWH